MQIHDGIERAKAAMLNAQQRYKAYADKKTSPLTLRVGDKVLVSTKNLRSRAQGAMKLMPRYIGPFPVEDCVNEQAYRLKLPASMRLHNVFHVSLLEPYREDGHYQPPPATVFIDGDVQYDVAEILDVRSKGAGRQFLVHWEGYGSDHDTWEDEQDLANCKDKLQQFWSAKGEPQLPRAAKRRRRS